MLTAAERDASEPPRAENGQRSDARKRDPDRRKTRTEYRDKRRDQVRIQRTLVLPVGIHHHELPVEDVQRAEAESRLSSIEWRSQSQREAHPEPEDECRGKTERRPQAAPA
jgi:hypothetical protein